jgi:hypothetical protein
MLPGITLKFQNGNLGTVVPTEDGVFGLLASAVAVVDKFALNTAYTVKTMADVAALGILPDVDNYRLYHDLKEFYEEAGEGTELWLMGFDKADVPSDWFTPDVGTGKAPVEALLDEANGRISLLFTSFSPLGAYVPTIVNGMDDDVPLARQAAQVLCENYTNNYYTPLIVLLEAYAFNGNAIDLPDLLLGTDNRVGIFIGATGKRTDDVPVVGTANHILAARLASISVHENAGMVKRGALETLTAYIVDTPVENYDVEALHDKGYVTFRTHVRKAGYFISDDPLATGIDDDYHYISRRRVIDKVFRLAHNIASDEILADFDLNNDGTISPFFSKTVEGNIEREIYTQMTLNGELSADSTNKDDLGVEAKFDTTVDVSTTNRIHLGLKVRPKGTARWFDISLGYDVNLNN